MTGLVVRLSRHWGCSPAALRNVTLAELVEMADVLRAEQKAARR